MSSTKSIIGSPEAGKERVTCECGSQIMAKNMPTHLKSAKHLNHGQVTRKQPPKEIHPAKTHLSVREPQGDSDASDEDVGDDVDWETGVEDDLKAILKSLDNLATLVDLGFSALMGDGDTTVSTIVEETPDQVKKENEPVEQGKKA